MGYRRSPENLARLATLALKDKVGGERRTESVVAKVTPSTKLKIDAWLKAEKKSFGDLLEEIARGEAEIRFLNDKKLKIHH